MVGNQSNQVRDVDNIASDDDDDDDVIFVPNPIIDSNTSLPSDQSAPANPITFQSNSGIIDLCSPACKKTTKSPLSLQEQQKERKLQEAWNCPICMRSSYDRKPVLTKCGHMFCGTCISRALGYRAKCPKCNTKLRRQSIFHIYA